MRKIFIDCGAYDGASVRKFKHEHPDEFLEWEIHSFEADLTCWPEWPVEGIEVKKKAVWIYDGEVNFHVPGKKTASSSINRWTSLKPYRVECIDLSFWIQSNFDKEDYIFLKMDVEGAEYQILEKMEADGTLSYINEIGGEFHNKKCGVSKERDEFFKNLLKEKYNLDWIDWGAEPFYKIPFIKNKKG
jgi:FkbM family methyltransferase